MYLINPYILGSTAAASNNALFLIDSVQDGGGTISAQGTFNPTTGTAGHKWYIWSPPAGVTNVCIVCVGAGGGGGRSYGMGGGAGGGLIYGNYIPVSSANQYYIQVGMGGRGYAPAGNTADRYNGGSSGFANVVSGTSTAGTFWLLAGGGQSAVDYGATVSGYGGGGGGAAGYYGNGGNGGSPYASYSSSRATGGAPSGVVNTSIIPNGYLGYTGGTGGPAGKGGATYNNGNYSGAGGVGQTVSSTLGAAGGGGAGFAGGAGGGVGVLGLTYVSNTGSTGGLGGAGAAAWVQLNTYYNGTPGSGGSGGGWGTGPANTTVGGQGGFYGGGGGGGYVDDGNPNRGSGYSGAVRIIWGAGRIFPSTAS